VLRRRGRTRLVAPHSVDVSECRRVEHVDGRARVDECIRGRPITAVQRLANVRDLGFPDHRSNIAPMPGPVLVLLVMFLIGPIGVFLVAAIWSAVFGWLLVDDTEHHAGEAGAQASTS
jgi:hypothetical protein